jgi:hypothetical protein
MRRLLARRWLWCLATVLVLGCCAAVVVCLPPGPYGQVREGMSPQEVEQILGPANNRSDTVTGYTTPEGHRIFLEAALDEERATSWGTVRVHYVNEQVTGKSRTNPLRDWWDRALCKLGLQGAPAPAVPPPVPPPSPPLPAPPPSET